VSGDERAPSRAGSGPGSEGDGRLTEPGFWADGLGARPEAAAAPSRGQRWKRRLGPRLAGHVEAFRELYFYHLLWRQVLPEALAGRGYRTVLEIGSAPGHHLLELRRRLGLEPFGVEYTAAGVDLNRRLFRDHGLDPAQVIHADLFDPAFQAGARQRFDVVFSWGFLEHFADPRPVVDAHLELLRPGGTLLVVIPNFRGLNHLLQLVVDRSVVARHNLEVMERERFAALFRRPELDALRCGYHGVQSLGLVYCRHDSRLRPLYDAGIWAQNLVDLLYKLLFRRWRPESRWLSPFLLYLGRRR
jgi:SAM-dependent methyltransferase